MGRVLIRVLKVAAIGVVILLVVGAVLHYAFGLQIVLDGGGGLHVGFPPTAEAQRRAVEAHRVLQRAQPAPDAVAPPATDAAPTAAAASPAAETSSDLGDWSGFRGPLRDGAYRERPIRTDWPVEGLKPLWKQPIGGGYASFAVSRGRAFTIEQRGAEEVAAAYDVLTGREIWTNSWSAFFQEFMGGDGPRATPAAADGIVYVLGATGELRAVDESSGKTIWRKDILEDSGASNVQWGMAGSPLIVDDMVVVHPGGPGQSVVAYNRRTGARVWATQSDRAGYAAPMLATLAGVRQIVVFSASRVMGLSTDAGTLLWAHPWQTQYDINAAQPLVVGENRLFVSSGYGTGAAVIEIARSGSGLSAREVWRNIRMKNRFNSAVLHDGFVYGFDEGIFACVDAATGDLKWKAGRYGYGQVLLASGHLIVLTEEGDLVLVRATPERHDERARFSAIQGKTWNVPAITGGILLVRNLAEMAAFDLRK